VPSVGVQFYGVAGVQCLQYCEGYRPTPTDSQFNDQDNKVFEFSLNVPTCMSVAVYQARHGDRAAEGGLGLLRLCVLSGDGKTSVGGSASSFEASDVVSTDRMALEPGTYLVNVERYIGEREGTDHAIEYFTIGSYSERPVVLTPSDYPDPLPHILPGFGKKYGYCGGCRGALNDTTVKALGKRWHYSQDPHGLNCWACAQCAVELSTRDFYMVDGVQYCSPCAHEKAEKCAGCGESILPGEPVMNALSKRWHPNCFECVQCRKTIVAPWNCGVVRGDPVCDSCLHT